MLLSLPCVDDEGREYGGEITLKFKEITAIQHMTKWEFSRQGPDEPRIDTQKIIPDCCTIHIGRDEFNVKADYEQLVAQFREHNEMFA